MSEEIVRKLTRAERSILLYVEACAVDREGLLDSMCMNDEDIAILERWDKSGFVRFGRLGSEDIKITHTSCRSYWCDLSDEAWMMAHRERKARWLRMRRKGVTRMHNGKPWNDDEYAKIFVEPEEA